MARRDACIADSPLASLSMMIYICLNSFFLIWASIKAFKMTKGHLIAMQNRGELQANTERRGNLFTRWIYKWIIHNKWVSCEALGFFIQCIWQMKGMYLPFALHLLDQVSIYLFTNIFINIFIYFF